MQVGFYQTDITPPVGTERAGSYSKLVLEAMHDRLYARAAVFDDGRNRAALVGLDICALPSSAFVQRVRAEIERRCCIPGGAILIAASHTHNGPCTLGQAGESYARAPGLIKRLALEFSPEIDAFYVEWLVRQTVTAVLEANRRKEEAVLSAGIGREDQVAFNRRFRMRQGRVYTHPGKGNPDIIEPAGPIDPDVGVIGVWSASGAYLGCVVNFACHGTVLGGPVASADWICHLDLTIRGVMGEQGVTVFLNGACGDVTQVNNQSLRASEFGERWSEFVGTRVGAEAVKVLATAERGPWNKAAVVARRKILKIPRRRPERQRLRASLAEARLGLHDPKRRATTAWIFAKEYVLADYLARTQPVMPVEVQVIQVGPVVLAANPSEFFCHLGLQIKKASKFPCTFVVELANGSAGYVPGRDAFRPNGGGYETVLTSYSTLATDAGEKIARAAAGLLADLKPGVLPAPALVKAPGTPWSYGVLGPDA